MAALHEALAALGPCKFVDLPTTQSKLDPYLHDLFEQSEIILESIPILPPAESASLSPAATASATKASEIISSSARSDPPTDEHASLQKEWGKPVKLAAKDNPLNMSVYKLGSKDGRGAWFARRSVHEGLGFAKFRDSLQQEFPESLAVQGSPGEGNIRGIGGDRKMEDISVPGKGRVEVLQLSAQFPGPTTPRDFVTLLVTSSNTVHLESKGKGKASPRHYMIVSKPCDHPDTQPRASYIRGSYESVEFIREIPRRPRRRRSSADLSSRNNERDPDLKRESAKDDALLSPVSEGRASIDTHRRRGQTVSFSPSAVQRKSMEGDFGGDDAEQNPVEWIMVTRSDPGGSVPRFMVERGTPSSIVADASKFLDWACQRDVATDDDKKPQTPHSPLVHQESFPSYESKAHLAGMKKADDGSTPAEPDSALTRSDKSPNAQAEPPSTISPEPATAAAEQPGLLANVTHALAVGIETYAPTVVLNHLPGHSSQLSQSTMVGPSTTKPEDDDQASVSDSLSTMSFASADSHIEGLDGQLEHTSSVSKQSSLALQKSSESEKDSSKDSAGLTQHEKELAKLHTRRVQLDAKLQSTRDRTIKEHESQTSKNKESRHKLDEKHARALQKQEDRFKKEFEKLESKKRNEEKKLAQRRQKESEKREREERDRNDKDEKKRLERERDEARDEVAKLKAERDLWRDQVGDLQKQNTSLAATVGRLEKTLASTTTSASLSSSTSSPASTSTTTPPSRSRSTSTSTDLAPPTPSSISDSPLPPRKTPPPRSALREKEPNPLLRSGASMRRIVSFSSVGRAGGVGTTNGDGNGNSAGGGIGQGMAGGLESMRNRSSSLMRKLAVTSSAPVEKGEAEKAGEKEREKEKGKAD